MQNGQSLKNDLTNENTIEPFVGIFDCFSATIGARFSNNLFYSGFGFAASHYGLPDNGYISWSDMLQAVWRVRQILPAHRMLVDIDDGYADTQVACRVTRELETMGAAMVMLEDQARPRRCGHVDGKIVLPLNEYLAKLNAVLDHRHSICVLARTDASGDEMYRRVEAIQKTEADAVLVDGIASLEALRKVRSLTDKPVAFNQMAGGKSPRLSACELRAERVALHIYSTPMLLAAQAAMQTAMEEIMSADGRLPATTDGVHLAAKDCILALQGNVEADPTHLMEALNEAEALLRMNYAALNRVS
jgi:2-methylisocitrate lyase-like PEP mutase family enzyme